MNTSSGTLPYPAHTVSKEEINALPLLSYEGEVILVQNKRELGSALTRLQADDILGFDTEARPTFKKGQTNPTALVQLAGKDVVVLVRISMMPFDETLANLLANPEIIKTGVAIHEDMRALRKIHEFIPSGLVDLAEMAKRQNIQAQGLRTLAASLMGFRISKAAQCSNWEKRELTPQQIRYAATDAWTGRLLYLRLKENEQAQNIACT